MMFLESNGRNGRFTKYFYSSCKVLVWNCIVDGCNDIITCLLLGDLYGTGAIIRTIIHDL
ncbi:hypothetical protein C0J52_10633 [Blattella germanica]|nr:hypothetical protein C0J52_10633 [Blattella germanica]